MQQLWTVKYFPANPGEFVGNQAVVEEAGRWAEGWANGRKQKPLLLFGQTGSGKTTLAYLVAKTNCWGIFELNASDFRTKEIIEHLAGAASQGSSFSGKPRLVLLDEVDGLQAVDRGGAAAIVKILKESRNPVMLTANEIYADRKLQPIRNECTLLEFRKINYLSIAKRLKEICGSEGIDFDDDAITLLAKNSGGDFRASLLDLQTLAIAGKKITPEAVSSLGEREKTEKIFSILGKIFRGKSIEEIRKARFSADVSDELLRSWIEENIPRAYPKPEDTAAAFERLSRADVFQGRIMRRQNWGFLRYSSELATAGVSLSRKNEYHDFVMYKFPSLLSRMSRSKGIRATKKSLAEKVSGKTHSGAMEVLREDLPYLRMVFQNKARAAELASIFGFDENEVAFLMNTKPETKKVQAVLEEAEKLRAKRFAEKRKPLSAVPEGDGFGEKQNPENGQSPKDEALSPEPSAGRSQTRLF